MLDSVSLGWRLLGAFPAQRYLQLLPWHFTAVLIGLGLLAGFGLHHLVGYTFGFYRAGGRHRPLLGGLTLLILVASVEALLLAYLLRTQADALIRPALAPENAVQPASVLGAILLDPPLSDPDLGDDTHVSKENLAAAIVALEDEDYRADLETFLVKPSRLVMAPPPPEPAAPGRAPPAPGTSPPGPAAPNVTPAPEPEDSPLPATFTRRDDLVSAIVVQIGLRWVLETGQTWPEAMPAGTGSTAAQTLRLPEFALALVDEIQDDAVLDRLDWEHVAGRRFVQGVLLPVLLEMIGRWAGLLALGVMAFNLAYFVLAARVVGHMRRGAKAVAPKQ